MTNDNAALLSMLKMVCDNLRYEANSPGGMAAAIEAVIADAQRRETGISAVLVSAAMAARDLEWVRAIHDACSNVSPSDPQGKPIDPADIKRCVDAHVRIRLQFLSV